MFWFYAREDNLIVCDKEYAASPRAGFKDALEFIGKHENKN